MVTYAYVIAGSEATGGAGIQVDLKTFHQLGVFGMGTITCVVSVDPKNNWAHRFVPLDAGLIADQIEAATSIHRRDGGGGGVAAGGGARRGRPAPA